MRALVVSGSAHPALAEDVAREVPCELATCAVGRFPDGEHDVEIGAEVRGQRVFIVQPVGDPAGEKLLELLLLADACRRSGAASVTAIVPYLAFARQDRAVKEGRPLGARVLADVIGTGRFSLLVSVDLHSPVIASCIDAPVAHLTAVPMLADALRRHPREDSVVVAPDLGAVKLAETYANTLGLPLAALSKVRVSPVQVAIRSVVGEVRGRRPILVDDMISTGTTMASAIDALVQSGCRPEHTLVATHGLFVGGAKDRLDRPEVARVVTMDTLPRGTGAPAGLEQVRIAPLLADAVRRIVADRGLGDLLAAR